ncbi:MAG TPA: globin domain-containing protein, partial [Fibrobacteria bacterium]|nr:globin domain-containing protein [Fibrobacteria bacterium]
MSKPALDLDLIESSFQALAPRGAELVDAFYRHLFADHPAVRPLFARVAMPDQKKHLLNALAFAVRNLRKPEVLGPALREMGVRHAGYGALKAHYPAVTATMLKSLAETAGAMWDKKLEKQWRAVLEAVAARMIEGAEAMNKEKGKAMNKGKHMDTRTEKDLREAAEAAVRYKSSIDGSMTPMMMVDRDLAITYANPATLNMVKANVEIFRSVYGASFDPDRLLGRNIDAFHKNPSHQRRILGDPRNLPHTAEIKVGPLTFKLNITAMMDAKGAYLGNTLEWMDVTQAKAKETDVRRMMSMIEGSATNFMTCDLDLCITYCNPAVVSLLTKYQSDLRKFFPALDVTKLNGVCIDAFHKRPEHQRKLLKDVRNLPFLTEIRVGELEFGLNLSALYDAQGNHIGNAVEWIDQNARAGYRREVDRVLQAMTDGELSVRGREDVLDTAFRPMLAGVNQIIGAIVEPLEEVKEKLGQVAAGDLSAYVTGEYKGDHQLLKNALNDTLDSLNDILGQVTLAADQV